MSNQIRIVIADDHPIFRSGLAQLLKTDEQINIVGEAQNGEKALTVIRETLPDVAVLDIDMPEKGGFEVAVELKSARISPEIIFLTMHKNETLFNEALNLGAKGFVLKDSAMEDILNAVKAVSRGENFISPALSTFLLKRANSAAAFEQNNPSIKNLTPTERRILSLIGDYKTSKEIADELFISQRTVDTHRNNISTKLGLKGTHALLKFALDNRSELRLA
jgi:DNA-binding NarL/FixJ family response regulator